MAPESDEILECGPEQANR